LENSELTAGVYNEWPPGEFAEGDNVWGTKEPAGHVFFHKKKQVQTHETLDQAITFWSGEFLIRP